MKLGVDADLTDFGMPITNLAVAVENAGLESLFLTQRIHVPASQAALLEQEGHEMDANLLDPFTALGAAAAVTSRLRLGTGACYAELYDPIILAKQVATLDHISKGRFIFGVTPGWLTDEVRNHGVEPKLRWPAMRETIAALKALWTQERAEFHGSFVNFEPVIRGLKPFQEPYPPILIGSSGRNGPARAAEYGDEWFPALSSNLDLAAQMNELDRLCQAAGRTTVPVTVFLWQFDESALARCAALGVARCVVYLYPESESVARSFLDDCRRVVARFED